MDLKELEKMKVDQLREEAAKLEGVEGISGMKKQELIDLLCEKLDIPRPEASSEEKTEEQPSAKDTDAEEKANLEAEADSQAQMKAEDEPPTAAAKEATPKAEVAEKKKSPFKSQLKVLQAKRKQALADRDHQTLADVRMRIKKYKRKMKKEPGTATTSS